SPEAGETSAAGAGAAGAAAGAGSALTVEIGRDPVRLRIVRGDGTLVAACAPDGGLAWDEEWVHWRMHAPPGWRYYGFGQKQGFLDKRGQRLALWATDETLHVPCNDELYRSEEHTSELQSRENLVCRLLLEKKKKKNKEHRSVSSAIIKAR